MLNINAKVELTVINCGQCGGTYAINERYRALKEEEGSSWTCPYCKVGWGYQGNEVTRLQNQLAQKEKEIEREKIRTRTARAETKHQKNIARAEKAAKTRIKNRVAAGVCPCCNRTFKQLASHMKRKHPEYSGNADT